jgi:hypothetical protein
MSGYLIKHLASGTSTIITGSLPLSTNAPQGAGVYEVHALSDPAQVTVADTQAATAPAAFGAGDWTLADSPSAGGDTLTSRSLPCPLMADRRSRRSIAE